MTIAHVFSFVSHHDYLDRGHTITLVGNTSKRLGSKDGTFARAPSPSGSCFLALADPGTLPAHFDEDRFSLKSKQPRQRQIPSIRLTTSRSSHA